MDQPDIRSEPYHGADFGERQRTWRMFVSAVRWAVGALALALVLFVLFGRG